MSRNDEKPSKRPLTIAIVCLALAFFALGVAVSLAVPKLRKSSSFSPTTPVVPFAPSRNQSSPTPPPATQPKTVQTQSGGNSKTIAKPKASASSPQEHSPKNLSPSPTSPPATTENKANDLNEDRN